MRRLGHAEHVGLLMIVFVVEIDDPLFGFVNPERDSPVPRHGQTPTPLANAGKLVRTPRGNRSEFVGAFHLLEKRNDFSYLFYKLRWQTRSVVIDDQPPYQGANRQALS